MHHRLCVIMQHHLNVIGKHRQIPLPCLKVLSSQVHEGGVVACAMKRRLGPIFNAANDAVEQALSTTSLAELVRGGGYISPKCSRHGHVQSKGVTTMGRLANKNILITGGNSGIGLAAAQEFDREGARVAICGLNESSLQAAKETLGAGSLALRADVSNLTDLDAMFATIKREFGHLDGALVNAGYSVFLPFEDVTEQSFDKVIGVDFKGVYFTIQKALPLLRQGSSVIITSSVGARKGWPTTSIVSSCKAAVVHLARILSAELVDRGIRVNTLSPGPTDTAMFGRFAGEEQGNAVKEVLGTNNPSKRIADPKEIAKLAVYLASDDSAYVVGADFLIDGGVTAISAVGA